MTEFTIKFTVPTNKATDILNTITDHLGYSDPDGNDGAGTRSSYLRKEIRDHVKSVYKDAKQKEAALAIQTATVDADDVDFT